MTKFKNSLSNFQKEVSTVTEDINLEDKSISEKKEVKDQQKNG